MRKCATSYPHTIINLTRAGLDRALLARKLWEACAIPAILYCVEAMNMTKTTVAELDRVQNMEGRFILQVPSATSRVLAWMDAGLMPMADRIRSKQAQFIWATTRVKHNPTLLAVLQELLRSQEDPWTKSWLDIQREIGIITNFQSKQALQNALQHMSIRNIMRTKQVHSTMEVVPQPVEWFKLQDHVSDSRASRDLCCVRGGNALLGNRFKNRYEKEI